MFGSRWKQAILWILTKMEKTELHHSTMNELFKYYGASSLVFLRVKKWFTVFCCDPITTCDATRSRHSTDVAASKKLKQLTICCCSIRNWERISWLCHFYSQWRLMMRKLCSNWVYRLLTIDYWLIRVTISKECSAAAVRTKLLHHFITVDET